MCVERGGWQSGQLGCATGLEPCSLPRRQGGLVTGWWQECVQGPSGSGGSSRLNGLREERDKLLASVRERHARLQVSPRALVPRRGQAMTSCQARPARLLWLA